MPISEAQLAANRANAAKSTGPRTPEGKARSACNARTHGFTASTFAVVGLEDLDEVAHLKADLTAVYQPVNSQELFALERMALTQQAMLRAARLESGLFTTCLDTALDGEGHPFIPMSPELAGDGDIEITRAQNRNYALADGFHRMVRQANSWSLFLRYQAQAERHYRRAVEEFDRLKSLRADLPIEPILEPQPEEKETAYAPAHEPISTHQPPAAPDSRPSPERPVSPACRCLRGANFQRKSGHPPRPARPWGHASARVSTLHARVHTPRSTGQSQGMALRHRTTRAIRSDLTGLQLTVYEEYTMLRESAKRKLIWNSLLVSCLCLAPAAYGQTTFGSITGVITDSSGAAVPKATVTAINEDTGFTRSDSSAVSGVFTIADLHPGTYRVRVEGKGFNLQERQGIALDANHVVNVDFQLSVGTSTTQVDVQAVAPIINSETSTTSFVKLTTQLLDTALLVRQSNSNQGFAIYNPGVGVNDSGNYYASGARQIDMYWTNDGIVEMQDLTGSGGGPITPNIENVAEMNFTLANAPAEFKSASSVTTVSKSGTNTLHGSLYYDYNGSRFNARSFFAKTVPFVVYNDFSGSIGGPIRKNKTFFFADYEGSRKHNVAVLASNAPLIPWRTGDFSGLLSSGKTVKNPFTGQPFPGNIVPSSLINPVSQKLEDYFYPQTNCGAPGQQAGNYCAQLPTFSDFNIWDGRVDHYFSERDTVFARVSVHRAPIHSRSAALPPVGYANQNRNDQGAVLSYTHTFSPMVLNEFRFGYSRDTNNVINALVGSDIISQTGIQGITTTGIPGVPIINVTGVTSTNINSVHLKSLTNFEWTDNISWTRGKHAFKFGVDGIRDFINQNYLPANIYGTYTFNGTYSGAAYADFLLGLPQTTASANPAPASYLRGNMWSFYAQDQYKVNRRLTLSYGVRWEVSQPYTDKFGRIFNYDPAKSALVVPNAGIKYINSLFPKNVTILTASQAGYPDGSLMNYQKSNIYPRIGLAYKLTSDNKTVIRMGYGLYGNIIYGALTRGMEGGPFGGSATYFNSISNGVPLLTFPTPFVLAAGQAAAFQNASGYNPNLTVPYLQQWNITLERQIGSVGLSVAYVGSHAVNLLYGRNINQPPPDTTPFSSAKYPNPSFSNITLYENGGGERYNALQVSAAKRLGKRLLFSAGWTWARDLTDQLDNDWIYGQIIQNQFDRRSEWGNNSFTPTHRFYADAVYSLPVGRNQRYLNQMPRMAEAVLGGWRLSGVATIQTGQWFTPSFSGFDTSNTNTLGGRPDVVAGAPLYPANQNINNWFNVAAFAIPGCPAGSPVCSNPANVGRFGNAANDLLQTPAMKNLDLAVMKEFHLSERKSFRFQATFSDALNHPNFGYPGGNISSPATAPVITSTLGNYLTGSSTARIVNFALRFQF